MLQTIEAEIDINGKIHWSEPMQLTSPRRVLITLLAVEEPTANEQEKAEFLKSRGLKPEPSQIPEQFHRGLKGYRSKGEG